MYLSSHFFFIHDIFTRLKDRVYSFAVKTYLPHASRSSVIYFDTHFKGVECIWIGENTRIARHGIITAWCKHGADTFTPTIKFGNNVSIGEYCHISAISRIVIGNNVLTGRRLTISDNSHGIIEKGELFVPPSNRHMTSKGDIYIGDNVWIGENVVVLPGVHIGESAIIGAGAIVTKDVPAFSVACGNPVRIIKQIQ